MPDLLPFLSEVALRSSLVLVTALLLLWGMSRASASQRHLVLVLGLLIVAWVPLGVVLSPKISWTISLPQPAVKKNTVQKVTTYFLEGDKSAPAPIAPVVEDVKPSLLDLLTLSNGLIVLLAGGMVLQMALLGRAAWSWQVIRREAVQATLPDEALARVQVFAGAREVPPIFSSKQTAVPLLAGWLRPAIILPAGAEQWPTQRLAMVLCHELAHFRRGDSMLLPLVWVLRILYWWHPLVWLALARLRRERENACDDLVLNQDFRATDYADLIVTTARQIQAVPWRGGALAMASSSNVGDRIRAILNPALNRRQAGRGMIFAGVILAGGLGFLFVAAQVQAKQTPAVADSVGVSTEASPQIKLEFWIIRMDEKTYAKNREEVDAAAAQPDPGPLVTLSNHLPGTSVLQTPSVTTQVGMKAKVDDLHMTPYATKLAKDKNGKMVPSDFKTRDLGYSIEATPRLKPINLGDQGVYVDFHFKQTEIERLEALPSGGQLPIFNDVGISSGRILYKSLPAAWFVTGASSSEPGLGKRTFFAIKATTLPPELPWRAVDKASAVVSAPPPDVTKPQVELAFKLIAFDEKAYIARKKEIDGAISNSDLVSLINIANSVPGISVVSAPSVTTQEGLKANIDIVREFSYPTKFGKDVTGKLIPTDFKTRDVGIMLEALPTLSGVESGVSLNFKGELTNFEGWKELSSGGRLPIFETVSVSVDKIVGKKGMSVWMEPTATVYQRPEEEGVEWTPPKDASPKRILLSVMATPLPPEPKMATVPSNAMVDIRLKYFQINEKTYAENSSLMDEAIDRGDISVFARFPDFDMVSEPHVLMKAGEQGTLAAMKDFTYLQKEKRDANGTVITPASTQKRPCGIRTVVKPSVTADGKVSLQMFPEITTYEGIIDYAPEGNSPVFNVTRKNVKVLLERGKPFGTWVRTNFQGVTKFKNGVPSEPSPNAPKVRLGLIVTADLYTEDGKPLPR